MREETFNQISLFLSDEEREEALQAYTLAEGVYERNTSDPETIERLDEAFGLPMVILSTIQEAEQDGESQAALEQFSAAIASGEITDEMIEGIKEQALASMGDMSDSIISQRAVLFVEAE